MPAVDEATARSACRADGIDPDKIIAGKSAWKHYTKLPEEKPEVSELHPGTLEIFEAAKPRAAEMKRLDAEHNKAVAALDTQLRGKYVRRGANEVYQITSITSNYFGGFRAKGRKIVQGGKLGSQTWDIGTIGPSNFKA